MRIQFTPIVPTHRTLAAHFYDSLLSSDFTEAKALLPHLLRWLVDEFAHQEIPLPPEWSASWKVSYHKHTGRAYQTNGVDCGSCAATC